MTMKNLLVAAFLVLGTVAQVHAQDKVLLDKARAEGKASFYANITAVEPIIKAFSADTGVNGEYTRISTSKFVATAITEFEAGKLMADVVRAMLGTGV
jgi:iron(III) transport system substrate-binding protein